MYSEEIQLAVFLQFKDIIIIFILYSCKQLARKFHIDPSLQIFKGHRFDIVNTAYEKA